MKVMVVSPYSLSELGGVQGQVLGLTHALRALGVDARIVAPCDGPPPEPGITTVGTTVGFDSNGSVAPIASGKNVSARTMEALRVIAPDVVHLHEPLVPGPTMTLLISADVPLVGTFHANYGGSTNRWYSLFRPPLNHWVNRLTVRTAVSNEAGDLASLSFPGEYEILPNGVDYDTISSAEPWPAARPAILFVGRHEPRKGLDVLLDAFAGLDRDAVLWVAGDGPESAALRARDVPGVEWLGRISDHEKARRLRGATIFCAPARGGESFGIVLLEGMAGGAAVVASDIEGYRNVARADRDALLFAGGDAGALRDALRRLLDDPVQRAELVAAGEERSAEFSLRHLAERFVPVYERALATYSRPGS